MKNLRKFAPVACIILILSVLLVVVLTHPSKTKAEWISSQSFNSMDGIIKYPVARSTAFQTGFLYGYNENDQKIVEYTISYDPTFSVTLIPDKTIPISIDDMAGFTVDEDTGAVYVSDATNSKILIYNDSFVKTGEFSTQMEAGDFKPGALALTTTNYYGRSHRLFIAIPAQNSILRYDVNSAALTYLVEKDPVNCSQITSLNAPASSRSYNSDYLYVITGAVGNDVTEIQYNDDTYAVEGFISYNDNSCEDSSCLTNAVQTLADYQNVYMLDIANSRLVVKNQPGRAYDQTWFEDISLGYEPIGIAGFIENYVGGTRIFVLSYGENGALKVDSYNQYEPVDVNPPIISFDGEDSVSIISTTYELTGYFYDQSEVTSVSYYLDGSQTNTPCTFDAWYEDFTCSLSDLQPGEHTVNVIATDILGHTNSRESSKQLNLTMTGLPALAACTPNEVSDSQSKLSAGTQYTCAVLSGGAVSCWGKNDSGQVGNGDNSLNDVTVPTTVIESGAKAVTTGAGFTCALMDDGTVKCWGRNDFGQLGTESTGDNEYSPVDTVLSGITAITAGSGHACALTTGGAVECWGKNNYGQVGNGDESGDNVLTPSEVIGSGAVAVSAGTAHTCALLDNGEMQCWGRNDWGQLGNQDEGLATVYAPTQVIGSGIAQISAGRFHTCALTTGGAVKCWGKNHDGQVGNATGGDRVMAPYTVISSGITAISAGTVNTCAVTSAGAEKCWGSRAFGQIGDGTDSGSNVYTPYAAISSGVLAVSSGADHTCAVLTNGAIECWGKNWNAQTGDGYTNMEDYTTPYETFPVGYACYGDTTTPTEPPTTGTPEPTPTTTPAPTITGSSINVPSSYVNIGTPGGMVVLPNGNVWYTDTENKRIVQFNPTTNVIIRTVGRAGSAEGEFDNTINSMTADTAGNLYVLAGCKVSKLDANGGFIASYDLRYNNGNQVCWRPYSITYDAFSNSLFVSDLEGVVTKFSTNGVFIHKMGTGIVNPHTPGTFNGPTGIATDSLGRIYVADEFAGNILQVFGSDYSYIRTISSWADTGGGTTGFVNIKGVVVLSNGDILAVSQDGNHVIEKFDSSGNHLATLRGNPSYPMVGPRFIARDSSNNIFVGDVRLNTIIKYSSSGTQLSIFSNNMFTDGKTYLPNDLTYGPDNHLYLLDGQSVVPRVQEFSNVGEYIDTIITLDESSPYGFQNLVFGPDHKLYITTTSSIQIWNKVAGVWHEEYRISCGGGHNCAGFTAPAFDSQGNLYVGSYYNHNVVKYVMDGGSGHYVYSLEFGNYLGGDPIPVDQVYEVVGLAVDNNDHLFVSDHHALKEFDVSGETPSYVRTILTNGDSLGEGNGTLGFAEALSIDPVTNYLYLSDPVSNVVVTISNSGSVIDKVGSLGGGQMQFYHPAGTEVNPLTGKLSIADSANGRIESLIEGNRILNLIPSADVIIRTATGSESTAMNSHVGESLSGQIWDPGSENLSNIPARLMFGDYVVADFNVNLTQDRNWSTVNVQTLPGNSKALVVNLSQGAAPGISQYHSLYVYRYTNQTSVTVCPDATILSQVVPGCSNEYIKNEGDSGLTAVTINGKNYWKIDGLSGTGAFSSLFETPFGLRDLMTREKVSTLSAHEINFSSTYDITHAGDTLTIGFGPEWNTSALVLSDVSLIVDSTPLTLAATATTNTWGVTIVNGVLTFTAPTDGTGFITAGKAIQVVISNAHITNPDTIGSYPISILLLSNDGGSGQNSESGTVNVPIVDSDQVNVTGFINTFINFDIDTGTTANVECAYNGCQSYAGGVNANNYTVDLGELTSSAVNKSQDQAVMHAGGTSGAINSIYFDLVTNAYNGAVVTVTSHYGWLQGPDGNTINSVSNGANVTTNSGSYGYTLPVAGTGNGTVIRNSSCQDVTHYCAVATSPSTVFDTNSKPLDYGRLRMDLAAAAAYTNNPGAYQDTLTFIATATF